MSETQQPVWKMTGHIGDIDPLSYGGGFVYEDETGVYPPEVTLFEPAEDGEYEKTGGATPLQVYRFILERDSTQEWWYSKLEAMASHTGHTVLTLEAMAAGTAMDKAQLYSDLVSFHGAANFDSYPVTMTEDEAREKYAEELKLARKR